VENSTHISGDWISALIQDFISASPVNTMQDKNDSPAWDDVLVGFASGADPIWQQYKEYVGAFHWTPWEVFNVALRQHVANHFSASGHAAVAPMLIPNWTIVKSERFSYASSWSERHAAHAAGLGTFGLCDGLITARGKAMRVFPVKRAYR